MVENSLFIQKSILSVLTLNFVFFNLGLAKFTELMLNLSVNKNKMFQKLYLSEKKHSQKDTKMKFQC